MNNEYSTKDLSEAAVLLVKKQEFLRIDRRNNICWFVFENTEACKKMANQFYFGDLLVNPREYSDSIKRLKAQIFNQ